MNVNWIINQLFSKSVDIMVCNKWNEYSSKDSPLKFIYCNNCLKLMPLICKLDLQYEKKLIENAITDARFVWKCDNRYFLKYFLF
jgi:hypothetical protein